MTPAPQPAAPITEDAAAIALESLMVCLSCEHSNEEGARFCDHCGRALSAEGATTRLAPPIERRPRGFLRGEPIYDPTWEQLCDPGYTAVLDIWGRKP